MNKKLRYTKSCAYSSRFFLLLIVLSHYVDASGAEYPVKQDGTGDFTVAQAALDTALFGDIVFMRRKSRYYICNSKIDLICWR